MRNHTSNFNMANWISNSTRDNSNPSNSTATRPVSRYPSEFELPSTELKFRKFRLIHQMERTFRFQGPTEIFGTSFDRSGHFGRSDRNVPLLSPAVADPGEPPPKKFLDQTEARRAKKIFFETGPPLPLISGSAWTPHPVPPYLKVCIHCPVPLFCILLTKKKKKTKRRVCATGMYRSIGRVKFPKFQTGIFVEWKAPRGVLLGVGQTKPHNQRYPCPKYNLARRKPLASHWWNLERWLADAFGQPLALESKRLQAASVVSLKKGNRTGWNLIKFTIK